MRSGALVSPLSRAWVAMAIAAASTCLACGSTVDVIGDSPRSLRPLHGPQSYPNLFRDLLGKTDAEIDAKIAAAFQQLFYGDPDMQAIYFPVGSDRALIRDVLHADVRTEGIGWGMLIAVELDKHDEFDRLWRYAKSDVQYQSGAARGYFPSYCDAATGHVLCIDPFGLEQFVMALCLAHDRWGSAAPPLDYAAQALDLFDVMRKKQQENAGIVDGITNSFDDATHLPFDEPTLAAASFTRPAVTMPAYYELWEQATGDPFWHDAALAAREYWQRSAHATTGLLPIRADFGGAPVAGSENFAPEAYRVEVNLALDQVWTSGDAWNVGEANRLLGFFSSQGIDSYGAAYALDGTLIDSLREPALFAANGIVTLAATVSDRAAYVGAVWDQAVPTGGARYYSGLLQMLALLALGGQLRVY